jgi:acyl-CoA reductase-like NAD-dependent aldehyde dehydrogenase
MNGHPDPDRIIQVAAPRNGALLGEVPVDGPEEVAAAVARVREVQRGWASLDPRDRARRLKGLLREIVLRRKRSPTGSWPRRESPRWRPWPRWRWWRDSAGTT